MRSAINLARKNELWGLIKRLGEIYDEDIDFIKEYAKDVYEAYMDDLEVAISCFKELVTQGEWIYPDKRIKRYEEVDKNRSRTQGKTNGIAKSSVWKGRGNSRYAKKT